MMRQRNVDQKADVLMRGSDHHLKNCNNGVGETISKNIYVDNVIWAPIMSRSSASLQCL